RHLGEVVAAALVAPDNRVSRRPRARLVDEEAEIGLQRGRKVDRVHQARIEQAVLDLADRAGWNLRPRGKPGKRQAAGESQLAQPAAENAARLVLARRAGFALARHARLLLQAVEQERLARQRDLAVERGPTRPAIEP